MSLAALIRGMAAAGAPPEAIALAVEAIEGAHAVEQERKDRARDKKRAQRAGVQDKKGTVPRPSRDKAGTVPAAPPYEETSTPPEPQSAKADCPPLPEKVVSAWNQAAAKSGLTASKGLDASRRASLKARVRDHGEQAVFDAIANLAGSKFHCGENDRNWRANLGWLLKSPENFLKALELAQPNAPKPLNGAEAAEHYSRTAELYDRMGRTEEANEMRKRAAVPIGQLTQARIST